MKNANMKGKGIYVIHVHFFMTGFKASRICSCQWQHFKRTKGNGPWNTTSTKYFQVSSLFPYKHYTIHIFLLVYVFWVGTKLLKERSRLFCYFIMCIVLFYKVLDSQLYYISLIKVVMYLNKYTSQPLVQ